MSEPAFDIRWLQVRAGSRVRFACEALAIPAGALTAIIGPNGAGKSSLLRALAGFHGQCDGQLLGRRIDRTLTADGQTLAWLGQHPSNSPLRVRDDILLGRRPRLGRWGRPRPGDLAAVHRIMVEFDLLPLADVPVGRLSGGERQRVALARAVVQEAPVVLLDEPGNHLDIRHQHIVMHLLRRLARQHCTVVCVLHDLSLAANYADWLVLVAEGRIARAGLADDVLQAPLLSELYRWPIRPLQRLDDQLWSVDAVVRPEDK
jgi:ABC-type cobalamin/Fe3+-siderophores transport system ATPase subunit